MTSKRTKRRSKRKSTVRFSVTLPTSDHDALKQIANEHSPPLSIRYVVEYAVRVFLENSKSPEFRNRLRDPRGGE